VEPGAAGAAQARSLGLNVYQGQIEEAGFPDGFFDVVRLSHVLEHLADPRGTFCEIKRILKPDGMVYVTVPNARSLNFWLFGENWYGLDAPRHVISYSPKTLRFLCDATGLEIIRMRFRSGPFNFVRSVKYYLEATGDRWPLWMQRINWPGNKLIRRALKPFFLLVDGLRLGDILQASLQKTARGEEKI
jgi:SAM-dependent methyltransferase